MNIKVNIKPPTVLAIAAVLIALPFTLSAQAEDQQAAKMVPADASFTSNVDSQKMPVGSQFRVKLDKKVRLENGPELPAGTTLVGQVVNDDTQSTGVAKLALNFTQAHLKNGQTIPIKATIVKIYRLPAPAQLTDYNIPPAPLDWTPATITIDQTGVLSGVDLHSSIDNSDSGVFVSTRKDDIKLSPQLGLELAIAERDQQAQNGGQ